MRGWIYIALVGALGIISPAPAEIVTSKDKQNVPTQWGIRYPPQLHFRLRSQDYQHHTAKHLSSQATFAAWLRSDTGHPQAYGEFIDFLGAQGVGNVVPPWTLLRTDQNAAGRCGASYYVLPPRELWPAIVPVLRLIRARVIPAIGKVEVVSAYRPPHFNVCAGGAPESRHMSFAAVDLDALQQSSAQVSLRKLCAAWRKAGPRSGWGLGAYFDPTGVNRNVLLRFHVDGTGYRSWGYSKKAATSACNMPEFRD